MTKDEFLAAWEEVCVEAAAKAMFEHDPKHEWKWEKAGGAGRRMYRVFGEAAYRAIGPKLMEGMEQKAWWDEKRQGIAKSGWRGATEDDEPLFRLTLPKEQP